MNTNFKGDLFAPASVGEATSLPNSSTLQNRAGFGKFVCISNILPINHPIKKRKPAGG